MLPAREKKGERGEKRKRKNEGEDTYMSREKRGDVVVASEMRGEGLGRGKFRVSL